MKRILPILLFAVFFFYMLSAACAQTDQTLVNGADTKLVNFAGSGCTYTWVNNNPSIGLPTSGIGNITSFKTINTGSSPITATITATPLPGKFAYIPNFTSNSVSVVDVIANKLVKVIQVGLAPFGVAVNRAMGTVYITNQDDNTVSVISMLGNKVVSTIPVGDFPSGVTINNDGSLVYVVNSKSNTVSVIDAVTNVVVNTIGSQYDNTFSIPQNVCFSKDGMWMYVTNAGSDDVSVVNTTTNKKLTAVSVGISPGPIILSPDGKYLYIADTHDSNISVINTVDNTASVLPIYYYPFNIVLSADGKRLYVTNTGAYMLEIDVATKVIINRPLLPTPAAIVTVGYGMMLSGDDKTLYVAGYNTNTLEIYDIASNKVTASIPLGGQAPIAIGDFLTGSVGCNSVTFKITVNPTPGPEIITTTAFTGSIAACMGTPSSSPNIEQFTVDGRILSNDIVATAPAGFEVSLTPVGGYGKSVTLAQTNGTVAAKVVYVRSSASATGNISGNIVLSSGTTKQNVAVNAIVSPLPAVSKIADQTKVNGQATDAVTFSGTGNLYTWVNDNPSIGLPASGTGDIASFKAINTNADAIQAHITVTSYNGPLGYTANYYAGTVSVFNTLSNKTVATIDAGKQPLGIAIAPDGSKVYVANSNYNTIQVINTATNLVSSVITVDDERLSNCVLISNDGKYLYVNSMANAGFLKVISTETNKVIGKIALNEGSYCIAMSPDGSKIYTAQDDQVEVVSTITNSSIAIIHNNSPRRLDAITVSPDGNTVYVSNAVDKNIIVIDSRTNAITGIIDPGASSQYLLVTADGKKLYAANFAANNISVINTADNKILKTIPITTGPNSLAFNNDGSKLYVTGEQSASVSVINTTTNEVINTIPVGLTPTSYGNFIGKGTDCPGPATTFTITVNSNKPTITSTGLLTALTTVYGTSSASASFTLSGTNLTAGILVSPPAGFDVSTDNINFSHSITLGAGGIIAPVKVYVRLNQATAAGNYSGAILLTSSGAENATGPNSIGTVKPAPLTITANTIHKPFGSILSSQSASTDFTATGLQNSEVIGSVTITYGQGANAADAINTYKGTAVPSVVTGGTFTASNYMVTYVNGDIIVDAVPVITYTQNMADLTTTYGIPSASITFIVSGSDLSAGILVNPPAGFEVSTDNVNFYKTVTIGGAASVNSVKVYIRLTSKTNVGTYAGYVVLSSQGAASKNISLLNNTVNKAPLVIRANNVAKVYGDILTGGNGSGAFTTSGLQNAETVGNVTITYDKGQAGMDVVGLYPGSVLPGNATGGTFNPGNYAISYINADLTVNAALLTVTAVNKSKKVGDPNPEFEATYSGFKNNESVSVLTTPPLLTTTAITASPVGQYPINVSGASAFNYSFNYVNGVLTIDPVFYAIKIPNAFTPNGDGTNDTWEIKYLDSYPSASVSVYNRYGANIFSSKGYSNPWNGKYKGGNVPPGAYYYIISLGNKSGILSGYVTVIR